jgi:hypothetical protein
MRSGGNPTGAKGQITNGGKEFARCNQAMRPMMLSMVLRDQGH